MCAVATDNAEHGAVGTMTRIAGAAKLANATTGVDFAHYSDTGDEITGTMPVARPQGCGRSYCRDHAHKLVTDRSFEPGLAARDFKIGIADAGERHAH